MALENPLSPILHRSLDEHIPGAVNLRDFGGIPAGTRRVRAGRLFRSGMAHGITPHGLDLLARDYGLRRIIDLRSDAELERDGVTRASARGIDVVRVPIYGITSLTPDLQDHCYRLMVRGEYDWCERYVTLLTEHPEAFVGVLRSIVELAGEPVLVHCAAGRDRTGIVAALVLALLGAGDGDIVDDYVRTGPQLARHVPRYARIRDKMGFSDADMVTLFRTDARHMERLLRWIEVEQGGAAAFVRRHGFQTWELEGLRANLLE